MSNLGLSRKICFYGNSLILSSLAANMRCCQEIEITNLIPPLPEVQELAVLKPDVIFFDLAYTHPKTIFPLLEIYPKVVMIGLNSDGNQVKIWLERRLNDLSTQDLLEIVNQ